MKKDIKTTKKVSRKKLVKKLDIIVSKIVRLRNKECVQCGSTYMLTAGHVFSRKTYSTRWDLNNVFAQCWSHNYKHGLDPYPYWKWYQDKFGIKRFESLRKDYETVQPIKTLQLEVMLEDFKKVLEALQTEGDAEEVI